MHHKGIRASDSPTDDDRRVQATVLRQVLAFHPTHLTLPEWAAEVCEDPEDFSEGDALARAVRDLAAASLLRMNGIFVVPTRAAVHFDSLLNG